MAITPMTDDDILKYTQEQRNRLVTEMTANGMPEDNKDRQTLLAALDGMDRQALGNKKVAASLHGSEADRMVATAIVEISKRFGTRNPYESEPSDSVEPPMPDRSQLPPTPLVPGESDIGIHTEKYTEFTKRMEASGTVGSDSE